MWLVCTAVAFQHSLLWGGPVTPSAVLYNGEEVRPVALIMTDIVTVGASFAMALVLDALGRAMGFLITAASGVFGLVLFAASRSVAMLSVGQVFYGVGFTGIRLTIDVLVADTARLKNRALIYALVTSPWAITAFPALKLRNTIDVQETRYSIAALSGVLAMSAAALFYVLNRYKDKLPGRRAVGESMRTTFSAAPFATLFAVPAALALMVVFIILWLLNMDLVEWYALVPPLVLLYWSLVALLFLTFAKEVFSFIGRLAPGVGHGESFIADADDAHLVDWIRGRNPKHVFNSVYSRTRMCTLGVCLTWKCT